MHRLKATVGPARVVPVLQSQLDGGDVRMGGGQSAHSDRRNS